MGLAHKKKVTFIGVTVGRLALFGFWRVAYRNSQFLGWLQDIHAHASVERVSVSAIGRGLVRSACLFLLCNRLARGPSCLGAALLGSVYVCRYLGIYMLLQNGSWNMDDWTKLSLVFNV